MYKRRFAARQALSGLLAVIVLPFFALAKPPDLPVRLQVDCEVKTVTADDSAGSGVEAPLDIRAQGAALDELVGALCPGLADLLEVCWRKVTHWLPVTCAPDCCLEPA